MTASAPSFLQVVSESSLSSWADRLYGSQSSGVTVALRQLLGHQQQSQAALAAQDQQAASTFQLMDQSLTTEINAQKEALLRKKRQVSFSQEQSDQKQVERDGAQQER